MAPRPPENIAATADGTAAAVVAEVGGAPGAPLPESAGEPDLGDSLATSTEERTREEPASDYAEAAAVAAPTAAEPTMQSEETVGSVKDLLQQREDHPVLDATSATVPAAALSEEQPAPPANTESLPGGADQPSPDARVDAEAGEFYGGPEFGAAAAARSSTAADGVGARTKAYRVSTEGPEIEVRVALFSVWVFVGDG